MKKLFLILLAFVAYQCKDNTQPPVNPPTSNEQWYCQTIADLQTDPTDSTEAHQRAVAYKDKFWPVGYNFKVKLTNPTAAQATMFRTACDTWEKVANIKFTIVNSGTTDLRITFNAGGGAWSYVGTDIKTVGQSYATMNLGWLAMDAYLHELGHTLGLLHEHQNPTTPIKWNAPVVYAALSGPPNNWTKEMIDFNVLNPYPLPNVITTSLDKLSIMMYPFPASWTLDGFSSTGALVLSDVDKDFIGKRYPFSQPPTTGTITLRKGQVDTLLIQYNLLLQSFNATTAEMNKTNELTKKTLGRINPATVTVTQGDGINVTTTSNQKRE